MAVSVKKIVKYFCFIMIGLSLGYFIFNNKSENKLEEVNEPKIKKNINTLSMMLETGAGSGNYEMTTRSEWPTKGYKFNADLSVCEHGSELSWDDTNKTVLMTGNTSDKCYIYFDKSTMSDTCILSQKLSECVISMSDVDDNIYHHDSTLANGAGDNSYRYSGGDYALTEAGKATGATMMIGYDDTVTTPLIDFYCNGMKQYVGYECNTSQTHYYLIKGDTTQYQTYKETLNKAVEKGYLTKDNVKNFVCFGSTASPCPTENLYRIIGVFGNNVKLIKWDYAKSSLLGTDGDFSKEYSSYFSGEQGESPASNSLYYWNKSTSKNTWSESNLNKTNLNQNFVNNIGTEWANKIATTTWKVGGNTWAKIGTSAMYTAYQNEIVNPVTTNTTDGAKEYTAKIGLMYVSDYGYAASQSAWTLVGYNSDYSKSYASAKGENWLYGGGWDWTISRYADDSDFALFVDDYGYVGGNDVSSNNGVRPSFNLESAITYVSGSGSANDPIVIN